MSESDSSDFSSMDSVDTEEEFRPHEVSEQLNGEYSSFMEFETDFAAYQAATFQTYVKLRSEKLQQSHVLYEALQFRKVVYSCVHHRAYKSKGTGKRKFVHSRKKECGAEVRITAQLQQEDLMKSLHLLMQLHSEFLFRPVHLDESVIF